MERVTTQPVKGIQHSFSTFLWREISEIRDFQNMGYFSEALTRTVSLIRYLPKEFQIKFGFKKKAEDIEKQMKNISSETVSVDEYTHMVDRLAGLDGYAEGVLPNLISELCLKLDEKGYLEYKPLIFPSRPSNTKMRVPDYGKR